MDSASRPPVDESVWQSFIGPNNKELFSCLACNDKRLFEKKNRGQHEQRAGHRHNVIIFNLRRSRPLVTPREPATPQERSILFATLTGTKSGNLNVKVLSIAEDFYEGC
ncbi:hypothetical protein NMY22_g794 [Coprinellus aureogranulatus]|nr:hypothetical protein NMY22_g794 [Coprinellus aureogranulatus]